MKKTCSKKSRDTVPLKEQYQDNYFVVPENEDTGNKPFAFIRNQKANPPQP